MGSSGTIGAMLVGTLSISAMHALIPSHWFSFAVIARAQKWTVGRTLIITLLAGCGHVGLTVVLGFLLAFVGKEFHQYIPEKWEHLASAGTLIALGLYFAVPNLWGRHSYCGHDHHEGEQVSETGVPLSIKQDPRTKTVIGTLIMGMTLSPCLDLLSIYVMASQLAWQSLLLISLVMTVTTLGIMLLLVWLSLHGLQRLRLTWLDKNEGLLMGGILIALGVLLLYL